MSSFTGVSIIDGQQCCCEASSVVDASADSGYHLLVVREYSRTKQGLSTGDSITSDNFMVGGHSWYIDYYPNGNDQDCAEFISLEVTNYDNSLKEPVETKLGFSFIDQVEKQAPMYIRSANATRTFTNGRFSWGTDRFVRRDALERSSDLKDDCFTIRCDIMVVHKDPKTDGDSTSTLSSSIHHHFNNLLQTKVGADVTFEVGGETFAAHRCVLAARSMVFMAQLFGPMKESTARQGVIQIKDMEAKVFKALLSFIYTDSFPVMEDIMEEDEVSEVMEEGQEKEAVEDVLLLQWLQDLLVASDRYDVQRLKCICEKQLSEIIGVSTVMSALALAEQHHCQGLKEACLKFIQGQSPSCLQTVMSTNGWDHVVSTYPSVLKELCFKFASNQRK